jgi:hypothetical protein
VAWSCTLQVCQRGSIAGAINGCSYRYRLPLLHGVLSLLESRTQAPELLGEFSIIGWSSKSAQLCPHVCPR